MSKGSRPRKILNKKKYSENWDKIFGKKTQKIAKGASKRGNIE
jgi:hypothetical protein